MNCKDINNKTLVFYADNALDKKLTATIKVHIDSCENCSNRLSEITKITSLKGHFADKAMPETQKVRIKAIIKELSKKNKEYLPVFKFAGFAALILLVFMYSKSFNNKNVLKHQSKSAEIELKERTVAIPSNGDVSQAKVLEEKKIHKRTLNIAKQNSNEDIVFRGTSAVTNKKFIQEWKGYSQHSVQNNYLIIKTEEKWYRFWQKHLLGSIPAIDFSDNIAVVVFSDQKEILIEEIKETGNEFLISIKETTQYSEKEEVKGYPFHIVVIKQS